MLIHKEIIIRIVFSFIFIAIILSVLGPVFLNYLKKKLPGHYGHENDIDSMIRRQKERLRAQYGLPPEVYQNHKSKIDKEAQADEDKIKSEVMVSKEISQIFKESQWGGGSFLKEIQLEITKNYSYTLADSKINAFIILCEKRNYIHFLNSEHQKSTPAIKNYLVTLLILSLLIEEVRKEEFTILNKISKKFGIKNSELALAFQIKLLMASSLKNNFKEDRIFNSSLVLHQYSEETIKGSIEMIARKEANLWAKGPSQLFEELTLALKYASMLSPIPKLKNRKDLDTALEILGLKVSDDISEIKKAYKKIALIYHPDKIVSLKLPKYLEKKAIERFNQIQEAYEVAIAHNKN